MKKMEPLLKWVGGKRQIADRVLELIPGDVERYVEPFVGGGAIFFELKSRRPELKCAIADINPDLINLYRVVRDEPDLFAELLDELKETYLGLEGDDREAYYYRKRDAFNALRKTAEIPDSEAYLAALTVFLNKTCFNGLYRLSQRKKQFNSPHGRVGDPSMYCPDNVRRISEALRDTEIIQAPCGAELADALVGFLAGVEPGRVLFYLDPPYKPVSPTAKFTSYYDIFDDDAQRQLAEFCRELDRRGHKFVLSNSDPECGFFHRLYGGFDIRRIAAKRSVNSDGRGRGAVGELLISN